RPDPAAVRQTLPRPAAPPGALSPARRRRQQLQSWFYPAGTYPVPAVPAGWRSDFVRQDGVANRSARPYANSPKAFWFLGLNIPDRPTMRQPWGVTQAR